MIDRCGDGYGNQRRDGIAVRLTVIDDQLADIIAGLIGGKDGFCRVGLLNDGITALRLMEQRPEIGQRITIDIGGQAAIQLNRNTDYFIGLVWSGPALATGLVFCVSMATRSGSLSNLPSLTISWAT
jgi:hypothetical protein